MNKVKQYSEIISNINFSTQKSERDEYENCEFVNCIFSDISLLSFINCSFKACNLSNCKVNNSKLQDVLFSDCKLLGINFSQAKDFAFTLFCKNCNMDYVSFDKKKLNKSVFENCKMHNANFTQADLTKIKFINCDLLEAHFAQTNLGGVDFTSSHNFLINPENNSIKKAKFLSQDLEKLLYQYDIIVE
jgi:uncharacterized protein YjbI with pentapeptide repeats